MRYRIVFRNGPRAGRAIDIPRDKPLRVGRANECEIRLNDIRLSKVHCRIDIHEGELRVSDLESSNGTFVNDVQVDQRRLHEGDLVRIGDVLFLVETASEAEAALLFDGDRPEEEEVPSATSTQPSIHLCASCGQPVQGATKSPVYCSKCRDPLLGATIANYRVLERLALGNTSIVYRAEHSVINRPCALKFLLPDFEANRKVVGRFLDEGRAGVELDHPNQVQVLNAGQWEGRHFLVMDFVSGVPIETLLGGAKRMGADDTVSIILQIAAALVDAEGKGWSHGDLSPRRILVSRGGRVRVIGFGTEWAEESARHDLHALGTLARFLLTGRATSHARPVKEDLPQEHAQLAQPLDRLLSPDTGAAYPSAMDFLLDVVPIVIRRRGRAGLPDTVRDMPGLEKIVRRGSGTLHELRLAADLTARLIPEKLPEVKGYTLTKATKPASPIVSDYYDVCELADGTYGIFLAGGPRTGVSGAMTMLMVRTAFQSLAAFGMPPMKLLEELHETIRGDLREGMTIPAVYALLDPQAHTLTAAQAGAPGPLVWNRMATRAQPTRTDGTPLSAAEFEPSDERTIPLRPGDHIVLATPWVTGAVNLRGEMFGIGGLLRHLRHAEGTLGEQLEALVSSVVAHRGPATPDHDLTVLGIARD
ncbi:MAG: SpoIIE family protein phosphatase [Planctomycetes bacterium]|nr:SpoIIE family protein phosphatase [Planctomycetota bacterium]